MANTKKHARIFSVLLGWSLLAGVSSTSRAELTNDERSGIRFAIASLVLSCFKKKLVNTRGIKKLADMTNTDAADLLDTTVLGLYNWVWSYWYVTGSQRFYDFEMVKEFMENPKSKAFRKALSRAYRASSAFFDGAYGEMLRSLDVDAPEREQESNPDLELFKTPLKIFKWRYQAIAHPLIRLISTTPTYLKLVAKIPGFGKRFRCPNQHNPKIKESQRCHDICDLCEGKHLFRELPLKLINHHVETELGRDFVREWCENQDREKAEADKKAQEEEKKAQAATAEQDTKEQFAHAAAAAHAATANQQQSLLAQFDQFAASNGNPRGMCSLCRTKNVSTMSLCGEHLHDACGKCSILTGYLNDKCPVFGCHNKLSKQFRLPPIADDADTLNSALRLAPAVEMVINKLVNGVSVSSDEIRAAQATIQTYAGTLNYFGINTGNLLRVLNELTPQPNVPIEAAAMPAFGPSSLLSGGTGANTADNSKKNTEQSDTMTEKFKNLTSEEKSELGVKSPSYGLDYVTSVLWHSVKSVGKLFLQQDNSLLYRLYRLPYRLDPWTSRHTKCPRNCLTICHYCKLKSTFRPGTGYIETF